MILEVCGLGSAEKRMKDLCVQTRPLLLLLVTGACVCPSKGRDPNLQNSQCLCVNGICLRAIADVKEHKYCIANSSQEICAYISCMSAYVDAVTI